ncbi:MAG: HEAT repeat domain-containing protein [Gemmatimonadota bacterium]|nr:HEAT repeat domain-containing protein [Gemmatimonadota bacterium]
MDHTVVLARQFAQLTWLLLHEPANTEEQKSALRALHNTAKLGAVSLAVHGADLEANGEPVPRVLTGVEDLLTQLSQHGLAMLTVDAQAKPGDLLSAARILASMPVIDDGGAAAESQRIAAGAMTVRFVARPRFVRERAHRETTSTEVRGVEGMEFGEVFDDPLAVAKARSTPRATQAISAPADSRGGGGLFEQFAASRAPTESYDVVLSRVETTNDSGVIARSLEDLVVLTEAAAREGKPAVVAEIMFRLGRREPQLEHFEAKRAFVMVLWRLARPELLHLVATQLTHDDAKRDDNVAVLVRAGENGAVALIERLSSTTHLDDRRIYVKALGRMDSCVAALLRMLSDTRWIAVRNAAELLGELQVAEAEQPLSALLQDGDERIRKSATATLMKLGTPRALELIQRALADPAPQARIHAVAALAARKDVRASVPQLLRALEVEKDEEVQSAFFMALGRVGTPDAVQRLAVAAAPRKGIFDRKTTGHRVAAVSALGEARAAEALSMLRSLMQDKDMDVRNAATFAIGRHDRLQRQVAAGVSEWDRET